MRTVLLLALLAGCGSDKLCTLIGCAEPARLTLQPALSAAGTYAIHLAHDGAASDCTVVLPAASPPTCDFLVEIDGGAIPALVLEQPWRHVGVTIRRDGSVVADATRDLAYTTSRPNGPGCEPTCYASEPVQVATTP